MKGTKGGESWGGVSRDRLKGTKGGESYGGASREVGIVGKPRVGQL